MSIGKIVQTKRKDLGLTQKELADGICAQALISKIENGEHVPKQSILIKLEKRLQFEKGELNKIQKEVHNDNGIFQLIDNIRSYLPKRDYKTIKLLLDNNKDLIDSTEDLENQVFFSWMRASVQHQLYRHSKEALALLNQLPLDEIYDELAIEIINAIGNITYQQGNFDQALKIYKNGLDRLNEFISYEVQAKLLLNYALTLEEFEKYREALHYIMRGIELLVDNNSLYLLGDYHHNKGQIFYKLGNYEEAKENFQLALNLFKLQSNNKLQALSQYALTEISNKLKNRKEE